LTYEKAVKLWANVVDGKRGGQGRSCKRRQHHEITILELAKKAKETTKCKSTIEFHPLPKDDPKRHCPNTNKLEKLAG
jgi:hypothetical protein